MSDIKYVAFDVYKAAISAAVLNLEGKLLTQTLMQTDATIRLVFLSSCPGLPLTKTVTEPIRRCYEKDFPRGVSVPIYSEAGFFFI